MRYGLIGSIALFFIGGCYWIIAGETTVVVTVRDEAGALVAGATVQSGWGVTAPGGFGFDFTHRIGITGVDGTCTLPLGGSVEAGVGAGKDGYYGGGVELKNLLTNPVLALNHPAVTINLLKKLNPVPMYVRSAQWNKIPILKQFVGFDLMKGDWVSPYGAGLVSDFIISSDREVRGESDYDASFILTFSNPQDGIQAYDVPRGSATSSLRLPRKAPESGYLTKIERSTSRRPDSSKNKIYSWREDANYIFRVRSVTNEKGEIVSAFYGKIHGDIEYSPSTSQDKPAIRFFYYLNPDGTNSLEWNGQNLFGELPTAERFTPEL